MSSFKRERKGIRRGAVLPVGVAWMGLTGASILALMQVCIPEIPPPPTPITVSISGSSAVTLPATASLSATVQNATGTVTYAWSISSGTGFLSSATGSSTQVSSNAAGTVVVSLTANDSGTGTSDTATFTVTFSAAPPPTPISVSVSGDSTVAANASASVTASVTGATGTVSYLWTIISGSGSLSNPTSATAGFTSTVAGTVQLRVSANDTGTGTNDTADWTITVTAPPGPTELTATATASPTAGTGTTAVTLTATAAGGTSPYTYAWTCSPSVSITNSTSATATVTLITANTYVFTVTVTDAAGATDPATATVVISASPAPTVTVTATPDTGITVGTSVALSAAVTGGTPPIASYSWTQPAGPGVTITGQTSQNASVSFTQTGTYTFRCTVVDSAGASAFNDVSLTVAEAPGAGITVNAGSNQTVIGAAGDFSGGIFAAGSTMTSGGGNVPNLTAVASDPSFDDTEISYSWQCTAVPNGVATTDVIFANSSSRITTWAVPPLAAGLTTLEEDGTTGTVNSVVPPGTYTFQVTANNPNAQTAQGSVSLTVVPAMQLAPGGFPALQGVTLDGGEVTTRIVGVSNTITVPFASVSRQTATLTFVLADADANLADATLTPSVSLTGPAAGAEPTVVTQNVAITSANAGTYDVAAVVVAGSASVAQTNTRLNVSVAPAVSGTIDVDVDEDASVEDDSQLGRASSGTTYNIAAGIKRGRNAGAVQDAPGNWAGPLAVIFDVNNDGVAEVLVADDTDDVTIIWTTANTAITAANPHINNDELNDGQLDDALPVAVDTMNFGNAAITDDGGAAAVTADNTSDSLDLDFGLIDDDAFIDLVYSCDGGAVTGAATSGDKGVVIVAYNQADSDHGDPPFVETDAETTVIDVAETLLATQADFFGWDIAVGQVAGESFEDIVIGQPGWETDDGATTGDEDGRAVCVLGQATAISDISILADGSNAAFGFVGNSAQWSGVGTAVAVGNVLNTDTYMDVIVCTPGDANAAADAQAGKIFVIRGQNSISGATLNEGNAAKVFAGADVDELLGRRVVCADLNNDGLDDVIVSGANEDTAAPGSTGIVRVFSGSSSSGDADNVAVTVTSLEGAADEDLGIYLATGDFDRDGIQDLFIAASADGTAAGTLGPKVVYIVGAANIFSAATMTAQATLTNVTLAAMAEENAGAIAAGMPDSTFCDRSDYLVTGDVNGDGIMDVLFGGSANVHALYGAE